jgi:hypothetical protein
LRLDGNRNFTPPELAQIDVQRMVVKNESHRRSSKMTLKPWIKNQDHLEQK